MESNKSKRPFPFCLHYKMPLHLPSFLATLHSSGESSSVGTASQIHCLSPQPLLQNHNEARQTHIHFMEQKIIKKALKASPVTFLYCVIKTGYLQSRRAARLPYFQKQTERERQISRFFFEYIAANTAIIVLCTDHCFKETMGTKVC